MKNKIMWVKASERLPGWRTPVKWRLKGVEMKKYDVAYISQAESPAHWMDLEWLDESATPSESPAEQPVSELEHLRRWKMEAAELLTKINSYAHKHLEIKLGECAVEFVIARAKKLDELSQENERLKFLLEQINKKAVQGRPVDLGIGTRQAQLLAEIEEIASKALELSSPEQPVREVEAVEFAEWLRDNTVPDGAPKLFYKWDLSRYTIPKLYQLFKEQKQPPAEWSGEKEVSGKDANEIGRVFINKILLLAAGFEELNKDDYEFFVKDKVEIWDFNGEYWIVDMLDQAGIEKQFQYMDELETLFHSFGLSFYNQQEQQ